MVVKSYCVIFDDQNDTTTDDTVSKIKRGNTATLPTPDARDGYTFLGWYTDVDTEFTSSTAVYATKTVYAKWSKAITNGQFATAFAEMIESPVGGILTPYRILDSSSEIYLDGAIYLYDDTDGDDSDDTVTIDGENKVIIQGITDTALAAITLEDGYEAVAMTPQFKAAHDKDDDTYALTGSTALSIEISNIELIGKHQEAAFLNDNDTYMNADFTLTNVTITDLTNDSGLDAMVNNYNGNITLDGCNFTFVADEYDGNYGAVTYATEDTITITNTVMTNAWFDSIVLNSGVGYPTQVLSETTLANALASDGIKTIEVLTDDVTLPETYTLGCNKTVTFADGSEVQMVKTEAGLTTALTAGGNIVLGGDITIATTDASDTVFTITEDVTIDGNGYNIYGSNVARHGILFDVQADVTVSDVTFDGFDRLNSIRVFYVAAEQTDVDLTIDGVTFNECADEPIYVENGTLTVTNSIFKDLKNADDGASYVAIAITVKDAATATITGNTFTNIIDGWDDGTKDDGYLAAAIYVNDGTAEISGNTFTNCDYAVVFNDDTAVDGTASVTTVGTTAFSADDTENTYSTINVSKYLAGMAKPESAE